MYSFRRLTLSTLIAVYILILVGGVVRSTGSGMGCPDWPKCFGQWTPPTSVDQLPSDYKEKYSEYRHNKNVRFAKYLTAFGLDETADKILADTSIREEADFNPVKTWIEYLNRIVGVIIGLLIFSVFISSLRFWKTERKLTALAFFTFVLVGFQGWIGSFVVSTNLTPWTVTVHMFLAIVIVALLIYLLFKVSSVIAKPQIPFSTAVYTLVILSISLLLIQILLGTQVREAIDRVAEQMQNREALIEALGIDFIIHRSFSWVVLVVHLLLIIKLWKMKALSRFSLGVILLILGTLFTGIGMAWLGVPPFLQPTHLLLATVTFGVEFLLLLQVNSSRVGVLKV
jgi:cytochrome c oxidase assembly protein subunit 15